jgi:hypothetical protein
LFVVERLRNLLLEAGYRYDIVDAVVAVQGRDPARAARAVKALTAWVERPDWHTILPAFARCVRITRDLLERYPVNPAFFVEAEEQNLYAALQTAENTPRQPASVDDFLTTFLPMIPAVDRFFGAVLVMAEDTKLRQNRLGLLQRMGRVSGQPRCVAQQGHGHAAAGALQMRGSHQAVTAVVARPESHPHPLRMRRQRQRQPRHRQAGGLHQGMGSAALQATCFQFARGCHAVQRPSRHGLRRQNGGDTGHG